MAFCRYAVGDAVIGGVRGKEAREIEETVNGNDDKSVTPIC